MTAVSDAFAFTAPLELVGHRGVVVVHLGVLVLRVELDDGEFGRAAVAHLVGPTESTAAGRSSSVRLPGPGPTGDEGVSEDERVTVDVVVLQPVVDGRRLGGGADLLAADGKVAQKDAVLGNLQAGLDLDLSVAPGRQYRVSVRGLAIRRLSSSPSLNRTATGSNDATNL